MKLKKMLIIAMALVMVLANKATVFAGELTTPGEITTEESGEGHYVDQTKYRVTLPTQGNLAFVMDPEGYYGYFTLPANSEKTTATAEETASFAGKIVAADSSKAATIKNESSVPVVITCKFDIASTVTDVTYGSSVTDDDEKQIALGVIPCTLAESTYTQVTDDTQFVTSTDSEAPTTMVVALDKADYVFASSGDEYTYELATTDNNFNPAYFQIGGTIAKTADWSELVEESASIALNCVYSFVGATDISGATISNGVVTAGADAIEYIDTTPEVVTPTCVLMNADNTVVITGATDPSTVITIKVSDEILTTANTELTSVKVNGVENVVTKGNNTQNGILYFTFAEGTTLATDTVVTLTIGETTYTCTLE